jgi:release factor glutamine methyltransferase
MAVHKGFDRGWALYQRHLDNSPSETFSLLGREWDLLDGVFAPNVTPVTELFTSWLPFPAGGSFLEVGCGTGVTAVTAALAGCARVLALDISAAAVANTQCNVARHGVTDVVEVMCSDLFDEVPAGQSFDLIFWNSNFAEPPDGFVNGTDLHHAFFDPDYRAHERYLREAQHWLAPGGRLLLGFSDIGNWEHLTAIIEELGLQVRFVREQDGRPAVPLTFQLLEISGWAPS